MRKPPTANLEQIGVYRYQSDAAKKPKDLKGLKPFVVDYQKWLELGDREDLSIRACQ
jgi:hypothetical protein